MNLRHLEVFRLVMQTGSVKGAAALMHVSEAAASKLLGTAERRMGLALFERTKGRLLPTPEARRLFEDVEALWSRVERIEALTHELANPEGGALTVAISPSLGTTVIPHAATALLARLPKLRINIELLIPHLLVQSQVDGTSELGVSLSPQEHPSLQLLARYPCRLVCVMPRAHPLAGKARIRPADLRGHDVVSFPQALSYGVSDALLYGDMQEHIAIRLHVRSGQTACWFSLAGAGVAIVDAATVAGQAFADLAVRPFQSAARLGVHVLRHRNRPLSRAGQMFCEDFETTWKALGAGVDA
ncbi:LysR substrate-binding domain-containing protein [Variovorax sp. KK3]|uniref:LysR substrate-binding domain-containing protein n=1 Tax=Variovorax sp. KK3 TaxID=1855728 RepID=UPI00097CBBF8|nr:LysR substrate-binding domain-containing protein [Variovorax sp. KK3]